MPRLRNSFKVTLEDVCRQIEAGLRVSKRPIENQMHHSDKFILALSISTNVQLHHQQWIGDVGLWALSKDRQTQMRLAPNCGTELLTVRNAAYIVSDAREINKPHVLYSWVHQPT